MRRSIIKSISVAVLSAAMLATTACNTKIEVTYDYNVDDYVTLGDYKSITVEIDKTAIEEEYIEEQILADQKTNTTYSAVDRESAEGDQITFDYTGMISGVTVSDLSATDCTMILGEDEFDLDIEEVADALYGLKAGKVAIITTTLPEDYSDLTYAGESVVFEISMTEVAQPIVPMITDAYCKEYYDCDTVDDYREYVRNEVQSSIDSAYESAKEEAVLTTLSDICEISGYPDSLLEERTEKLTESIGFYATWTGYTMDEYCQNHYDMTFDEFVKKAVAQQMVIEAVCKAEGFYITEYQYKDDLDAFAIENGYSSKTTFVEKFGKDTIVKGMLLQKTQDYILEIATVVDK